MHDSQFCSFCHVEGMTEAEAIVRIRRTQPQILQDDSCRRSVPFRRSAPIRRDFDTVTFTWTDHTIHCLIHRAQLRVFPKGGMRTSTLDKE